MLTTFAFYESSNTLAERLPSIADLFANHFETLSDFHALNLYYNQAIRFN